MATKQLTRQQAKRALGDMPERSFARWVAKGLPRRGDGTTARFPWPEIFVWLLEQYERRGRDAAQEGTGNAEKRRVDAEARLALAKAEAAELDLAERRRELDTRTRFRQLLADAYQRVKAQLLAMGHKHAPEMVGLMTPVEAAARLDAIARSVMDELHQARDVPAPDTAAADGEDEQEDA